MKIAILGKMRSGKNEFANFFEAYGLVPVAFGDEIGRLISRYFPEAFAQGKPREHYQLVAQTFRKLRATIWIDEVDKTIREYGLTNVIVTDLRQLNEYEYLKANGYTIVKIEAAEEVRLARIAAAGDVFDPEVFNHETEEAVDLVPYDYLVTNNGTIEELLGQAEYVLSEMKGLKD